MSDENAVPRRTNDDEPLQYLAELPEPARYRGSAAAGEAEIVERLSGPGESGPTGIIFRDEFHTVVRDAVKFPSGAVKPLLRIIGAADGVGGVVILASLGGRIQLRWMFRHPTRRWELEAARGRREAGDSSADAARNEVSEELGMRALAVEHLGTIAADSALLATAVDVMWADVACDEEGDAPEEGEAMGKIESLSPAELWERVNSGVVRDSHTLSAILFALARGKLPPP